MNWYTQLMEKSLMANDISQHNHDTIYAIVRDAKNGALSVEDAVARIKGLDDGRQLTNENFEEADNVKKNNEKEPEFPTPEPASVDPGEGADADVNRIVGVDTSDDTSTLGVVTSTEGDSSVSEAARPKEEVGVAEPDEKPTEIESEESKPKKSRRKKEETESNDEGNTR